jgi:hypothetical protein
MQATQTGGSGKAEGFADGERAKPSASVRLPLPPKTQGFGTLPTSLVVPPPAKYQIMMCAVSRLDKTMYKLPPQGLG